MTANDDDRIAYLAGENAESLPAPERADLDELRALLAAPATWAEPAPELEDQVVAAIGEEAAAQPAGRAVRRSIRLPRVNWRPPTFALTGAAAAALVALVIALSITNGGPPPQRFAMVLTGTNLAPGVHGNATLTKTDSGWDIKLTVPGLPRLDNGRYYEAWLKNAAGILVPIGTFNDARHVTLWAGVPPTKFPTLTVTQQQANGNAASSGKRVLTGTLNPRH